MAISEPVNKYFGNSENVGINAKEFVNSSAKAVVGHGSSSAGTASNTATGVSTSGIVTSTSSITALTGSVRGDVGSDQCHVDNHNEYHGEVVKWGAHNIQVRMAVTSDNYRIYAPYCRGRKLGKGLAMST